MKTTTLCLAALTLLSAPLSAAFAHEIRCGELLIDHPYATAMPAASKVGAVYFMGITNQGKQADQLVGAQVPVSASVEIHEMAMNEHNVMKMRQVPAIDLPPGATVSLKQGQPKGYHLMLMGLKGGLKAGSSFPITLKFQHVGACKAEVKVQTPGSDSMREGTHDMHDMGGMDDMSHEHEMSPDAHHDIH